MQGLINSPESMMNSRLAIDAQAVGGLRAKAAKDPAGTTREVARQFEKMFLDMVLKSMRDATPKFDGLESDTVGTFRSMYDQQLTQTLTSGKGIGLADIIAKQISRMSNPESYNTPVHKPQSFDFSGKTAAIQDSKPAAAAVPADDEASQFVANVATAAENAAESIGVSPNLVLAHAALESGWGKKPITDNKGQNTYNVFGVKAGGDWTGRTADIVTTEFVGGVAQKRVETFRAYDSYSEAFADYAKLIGKRFGGATQAGSDAQAFARGLQQGGYATDPSYADKLVHVAMSPALRAYRAA